MTYQAFTPHRSVREYRGQVGNEAGGMRLPWYVLDSLGATIPADLPDQYVVVGEHVNEDGRSFLEFGVTRAYVEATTDVRWDGEKTHRYRLRCPLCFVWDGKHVKGCAG